MQSSVSAIVKSKTLLRGALSECGEEFRIAERSTAFTLPTVAVNRKYFSLEAPIAFPNITLMHFARQNHEIADRNGAPHSKAR
ncbi:MAG: hypothetical protein ACLFWL_16010 [Candidatus Brocadiia bacterium]